jgi:hypothetical protein
MTLTRIFAAVLALDVLGLAVTLISGNEDLVRALVVGTPINAPFTFVAVQALIVLAATRHRAGASGWWRRSGLSPPASRCSPRACCSGWSRTS